MWNAIEQITIENLEAYYLPETERQPAVPLMMDGFEPVSGESIWLKNVAALNVKHLTIHGEAVKEPVYLGETHPNIQDLSFE